MALSSPVSPDLLLSALNTGRGFGSSQRTDHRLGLRGEITPREERVELRKRDLLREYVDEWLVTGVEADGREVPARRKLVDLKGRNLRCKLAAQEYVTAHPPRIQLSDRGPDWGLVFFGPPHNPSIRADEVSTDAVGFFACMLASDWAVRIAKCRYHKCGRYFLLKRLDRVYPHGTFCGAKHSKRAGAHRCTKERRKRADEALLSAAAKYLREWRRRHARSAIEPTVELKQWLVQRINRYIRTDLNQTRQLVAQNWVTSHWKEIEGLADKVSRESETKTRAARATQHSS